VIKNAQVGISVYDAVGRLVIDKGVFRVSPGKYTQSINLNSYGSGIYYVRLSIDNQLYFKKLMVK
jgi:hypothetical protein